MKDSGRVFRSRFVGLPKTFYETLSTAWEVAHKYEWGDPSRTTLVNMDELDPALKRVWARSV